MIGKTISHYRILEKLGEGGMGVVYKAQDTKLDRFVALKFLPQNLNQAEEEKQRFIHEAKAASALDHPNICTIHEIDETEDGQMFIAMACYEGESLKAKIESGPLLLEEAIYIAVQIAQGLARAHEEDIVHRDIKPANVMITNRGEVKIVDFGLAKLSGRTKLTKEGTTLGTVAYMSPEQAQSVEVDHRTDLWALGAVLYEMTSGRQPFEGEYEQAVMYSIMNDDPEPMTALRTGVPMELERIVNKCLVKEPSERYQHVDELLVDLRRLQKESKLRAMPSREGVSRATPRNRLQSFVIPGILIFIAIIIVAGYFFLSREAQGPERVAIAVVDFVNETNEKELNGLSGMLITSLEQSRRLSVLTRSRMFDILNQLEKQDVERIDETLGREICQHANVSAMVIASIRKFGQVYTIDLKVLDPQENEYLFTAKVDGKGQESIPSLIDELSDKTRKGLKEKEEYIQATSQKVAEVTTINLEAYQHYFKGEELINKLKFKEAKEELNKAISLDTTFALAYYRLAYAMSWQDIERPKEPIRKMMQYLDKAPEKERYLIRKWNAFFEGNLDKAIALCQELLKLYPEEKEALYEVGNSSYHKGDYTTAITYLEKVLAIDPTLEQALQHIIWTYRDVGQYDKMLDYAKQYVAKTPTSEVAYDLLGDAYSLRADFDNALQTYRGALVLFPKSTTPIMRIGFIYIFKDEYEKAEAEFKKLLQSRRHLSEQRDGYISLAVLYAYLGKYREVIKMMDKIIEIDLNFGDETDLARRYAEKAFWFLVGWNDVENAKRAIEKGLESKNAADMKFYSYLCLSYLMSGEYEKALSIAKTKLLWIVFRDFLVRAYVHRAKGDYDEAIKDFQMVTQLGHVHDKVYSGYNLALCYLETGQNEKAIEALHRMQRIYWAGTRLVSSFRAEFYPKSFYLLGKIYEKQGDKQLAIESYEKFFNLWRHADKDLPELLEAKVRLAELKGMSKK